MVFTGKTTVLGILGDPIAHSLSPLMQNEALRSLDIDAVYVPFHVLPEQLPGAVEGLRALQVAGVNVTVPHKQAVIPLLDEVDARAQLIGAVNTIVNRQNRLIGYNTDGIGFLRSVQQELGFQPQGKRIVLLGAGGACRAVVVALADAGVVDICIANRSLDRAAGLVEDLQGHFPAVAFQTVSYQAETFHSALLKADLLVNTTSIGLKGENVDFFQLENINPRSLIYDMVYSKTGTPLLHRAKSSGLRAVDGLGMLAGQGEEAFYLWTGQRPAPGLMRKCLMDYREN